MNGINLIIFILFLLVLRNFILGTLSWRKSNTRLKSEQTEVTQRFFAEARNDLMNLVQRSELMTRSTTFQFFYYLDTFVMRRPNDYKQISMILVSSLVFDENSNSGIVEDLMRERKNWSKNVKKMISKQSMALNHLLVSHSFILRNCYRVALLLLPVLSLIISSVDYWESLKEKIAEKDSGFVHNVYQSEKTLESLITT